MVVGGAILGDATGIVVNRVVRGCAAKGDKIASNEATIGEDLRYRCGRSVGLKTKIVPPAAHGNH